ncbi:NAD-dependent epimerase/dehydratase family protein [Pseudomonas sp. B2M1-30]|uniref:NAD-dependent epimerase/dehydratase family protein n=1 Tax=Pseudomonas TaxID=286 RepID=UPI0021CABD75|nr:MULTISPECIES: NAD-dependent epimerase/dehydratase family protein [Pseudomonas]MCU0119171.1 NAD-dependent epimerase/dehydratase family protein [Pseudomonas sp. B2M1-30]MCU7261492.1 NAD-dependent epimerase/dehydratase family protein [Pseudomonas koreensis]
MKKSENSSTDRAVQSLVLGGRGFIGTHLIDALLDQGHAVRCFDRPNVVELGESHAKNPHFELYEGDFTSEADISEALQGCDICYHLVSTTLPKSSNADPVFDVESNLVGTIRLLNLALEAGIKKVIFVSSGGTVYGDPVELPIPETHPTDPACSYGIAKLAIEKYLALFHRLHGLDYTVLRLANPFGEGQRTHASQGAVAVFLGKVLRNESIEIWGDGSVVRDYIHVDDVIQALLASLEPSQDEHVFNIGSGQGHSLNDLLDAIEKITGRTTNRQYLPARGFDVPVSVLSIERAKRALGWAPAVSFEQGLEQFVAWLDENPAS